MSAPPGNRRQDLEGPADPRVDATGGTTAPRPAARARRRGRRVASASRAPRLAASIAPGPAAGGDDVAVAERERRAVRRRRTPAGRARAGARPSRRPGCRPAIQSSRARSIAWSCSARASACLPRRRLAGTTRRRGRRATRRTAARRRALGRVERGAAVSTGLAAPGARVRPPPSRSASPARTAATNVAPSSRTLQHVVPFGRSTRAPASREGRSPATSRRRARRGFDLDAPTA